MRGNDLSKLDSRVVTGEDYALLSRHAETVSFPDKDNDEALTVPNVDIPVTDNVPPIVALEATERTLVPVNERFALFHHFDVRPGFDYRY